MPNLPLDTRTAEPPFVQLMSRSHLAIGLSFFGLYVMLDWVSYVQPFAPFGITPWNPQTGLSFALILLFGYRFLLWPPLALFAADLLVRDLALPWSAELLVVMIVGSVYGAAALLLRSPRLAFDPTLSSRPSLIFLVGVAVPSIALVAVGHSLVLWLYGIIQLSSVGEVALRAFIGDLIGVMVFAPFLLIAFSRRRFPAISWEIAGIILLTAAGLWVVFGFTQAFRFQLFYVLLLPVIWTGIRYGLEGVAFGLVATQVGLIIALELSRQSGPDFVVYQALMTVISITGLAIGVVVSEQRRTEQQLRLHQEALHRAARLRTMGEFAGLVAHEINQPLTAIANYCRLAKHAAEQSPPKGEDAASASAEAIAQVDRASAVIRQIREYIRFGKAERTVISAASLLQRAVALSRAETDRHHISIELSVPTDLPAVSADRLQIEQVVNNLVRNAVDALVSAGRGDGRIVIEAKRDSAQTISVSVRDNGPGLDPDLVDQPITAFATTKLDGLGLGLSLSRSIIEAHGGSLKIVSDQHGTTATFALQTACM
jgi:two-component system, LuxR family, sensor kinase FixL